MGNIVEVEGLLLITGLKSPPPGSRRTHKTKEPRSRGYRTNRRR